MEMEMEWSWKYDDPRLKMSHEGAAKITSK